MVKNVLNFHILKYLPKIMFGLMLVATVLFLWSPGTETSRFCTYSNETHISENVADILHHNEERRNQKVECPRETRSCYTFWRMENTKPNGTLIVIIYQGCWEASGVNDCSVGVCNPLPSKKELRRNGFCCCIGNFCNGNINFTTIKVDDNAEDTDSEIIPQGQPDIHKDKNEEDAITGCNERKAIVLGGCAGLVMVIIVISVLLSRRWTAPTNTKNKTSQDHRLFRMSPEKSVQDVNNTYSVTHLNLDRVVGQGRYSTVWLGKVKDHQVAVKMFPIHKSNYFYNEKDIYSLPFMQHPSFLTYFGCDEIKRKDGDGRLVLVLSYCPLGNLQEYLRKHTLDLMTFTKMALSISTGLAYLHTEIHKQGKWKPCVTHRDINTRNILVKDDLSCCIADLGLAVKITGCHYYTLGEEQHAEAKSINDVGTLRYMAPEVLEGAVNLRDCESSLKQIDVYALGLVLWELSIRVVDFYNKASDVPDYALPFEKEIGLHPTLEDMQILVCRNKARPLFPLEWKNTLATRTMRETVEDCTDQDGEARLTALCVQERINQICRGSSQIGSVSPTVNQTGFLHQNSNYDNYNNLESTDLFIGEKEMVDGGVSEGTVETMVTMSPSESLTTNINTFTKDLWGAVQPYQGRNPCLERNLLCSESSDEVFVVETSRKHGKVVGETSIVPTAVAVPLYSGMPTLQKMGFTTPKKVNTDASKIKPKQNKDDYNALLTRVIVSPFENVHVVNGSNNVNAIRPSSLDVLTTSYNSIAQDDEEDSKRLKELSGRIRTPGDLPPSVRRTRGSRQAARLSLYDDRIMTCSRLIDTTF